MNERQVEGVVLKSIPFKESDRILSVFTPNRGIISLFVKRLSKSRLSILNLTSPLCRGEFVFRKGRSDLYRFIDGTIIDLHLKVRRSYKHLKCAGKMLNAILTSQMPGKSAPALYALLISYLKHLSDFSDPIVLWASFQLKLLKHEGLLAIDETCLSCSKAQALRIIDGESRCIKCADTLSFPFSKKEWEMLTHLFHAKQFETLKNFKIESALTQEIETLYNSLLS